jgi:hypothetical protein
VQGRLTTKTTAAKRVNRESEHRDAIGVGSGGWSGVLVSCHILNSRDAITLQIKAMLANPNPIKPRIPPALPYGRNKSPSQQSVKYPAIANASKLKARSTNPKICAM